MLEPLTRVLLWAAVGLIIWYVLLKLIPRNYLTWFGGLVVLVLIVVSFVDQDSETVQMIWDMISLPLQPLGLAMVFLLFSLREGIKKVNGNQVFTAFLVLLVAGMPLISRLLVDQAEQSVRTAFNNQENICAQVCPPGQPTLAEVGNTVRAIVVLGDSQMDTGQLIETVNDEEEEETATPPSLISTAMAPRLLRAGSLYQEVRNRGGDPWMIITMNKASDEEEQAKATEIRRRLTANGVSPDRIEVQDLGTDIRKSAEESKEFLEERQFLASGQRIMLVTPALAMRRASLTFSKLYRELGVGVVARPTGFYISELENSDDLLVQLRQLFPNVEALSITTRVVDEYLTWGYYFLRGWLPSFNVIWTDVVEVWGQ